ncbi:MAG: hypothetical protein Q8L48_30380 [Archangium sp.]|nr:hypothetical protein [Archangium sp.]
MKPQYVFSFFAAAATAAVFWHPKPPEPVVSTRVEDGFEVRITRHAEPHRFEELPVPALERPDRTAFQLPQSYLRNRLCAGDDVMLAGVQARLLLTPGEGEAFGALAADCAGESPFCARAAAALAEDAGLSGDELWFFAQALAGCAPERLAPYRADSRLPLEVRVRAWIALADAGSWSPELGALIDEDFATNDGGGVQSWRLATAVLAVREDSPELLDASKRLMDRYPLFERVLRRSPVPAVRAAACARIGCDAGVEEPVDGGIEPREALAACALRGEKRGSCLEALSMLDWPMAHLVAKRVDNEGTLAAALRAFETREAFVEFARSVSVSPRADGGLTPWDLLGLPDRKSMVRLFTADGLGHDELAARWAEQAPELKGAFFIESGDGDAGDDLRLSVRHGDDHFSVLVRRERESLDARAVLALLNATVSDLGGSKRFFLVRSDWMPLVQFSDPAHVAKLVEHGLVELEDPDLLRQAEE